MIRKAPSAKAADQEPEEEPAEPEPEIPEEAPETEAQAPSEEPSEEAVPEQAEEPVAETEAEEEAGEEAMIGSPAEPEIGIIGAPPASQVHAPLPIGAPGGTLKVPGSLLQKPQTGLLAKLQTGLLSNPPTGRLGKPETGRLGKPETGRLQKPQTGLLNKLQTALLPSQTGQMQPSLPTPEVVQTFPSGPTEEELEALRVRIPLRWLVEKLPIDLRSMVISAPSADSFIFGDRAELSAQISAGSVQMLFGQIRRAAPRGCFVPLEVHDGAPIALPVNEMAALLNINLPQGDEESAEEEVVPTASGQQSHVGGIILNWRDASESWPDELAGAVASCADPDAQISIPLMIAAVALRQGRVVFPWSDVMGWFRPELTKKIVYDSSVEFPLKPVVLQYMAQASPPAKRPKVAVASTIPVLFRNPDKKSDAVQAEAVAPEPKIASPMGTIFGNPDKAEWPPIDIVNATRKLEGVDVAMLSMTGGFNIVSEIPEGFEGSHFAAFIPQMFTQMDKSAKDMRLGAVTSVSFVAGGRTCQAFRRGPAIFAVVSQQRKPLPSEILHSIMAELHNHIVST